MGAAACAMSEDAGFSKNRPRPVRRRAARASPARQRARFLLLLSHVAAEIADRIARLARFPLALDLLGAYHGLLGRTRAAPPLCGRDDPMPKRGGAAPLCPRPSVCARGAAAVQEMSLSLVVFGGAALHRVINASPLRPLITDSRRSLALRLAVPLLLRSSSRSCRDLLQVLIRGLSRAHGGASPAAAFRSADFQVLLGCAAPLAVPIRASPVPDCRFPPLPVDLSLRLAS